MQASSKQIWLRANWPLKIQAGTSLTPHPHATKGFSLAHHQEIESAHIIKNRTQLAKATALQGDWLWLKQTHSATVIDDKEYDITKEADALISRQANKIAVVLTADCLPILIADIHAQEVAAVHAGWQGLYKNIISATLKKMHAPRHRQLAWIGPCASAKNYEVDESFYQKFIALNPRYKVFFKRNREQHYLADLVALAQLQLQDTGIPEKNIYLAKECSIANPHFFSHRRDGLKSGRMASFIAPLPLTK